MTTKLSDVIVPELFNSYVTNKTMELSNLVSCGVITNNAEFNALASNPAPVISMPFFEDLTGESEAILEGEELTSKKITSKKDVATIIRRAGMWSATDLSASLSGADPMGAIGNLVAGFWARDLQKETLAVLKGVFASESMAGHVHDISGQSGNNAKWSASAFIDAQQLLGDAQDQLTAIIMHSATKSALKKQNLITTERPSMGVEFETYQGKRVIVDDGMPVDDGVYTTYLFGQGALALGNGSPVGFIATEVDRDKRMGSGVDYLINRKTYIIHPRGIKWTNVARENVETPTRTELANGSNWELVYEPKQIRIVAFKHKL